VAVVFPSLEQLNELEHHLYAQAFSCFGVGNDKKSNSQKYKQHILNELIKGLQPEEYAVCSNSLLLAEIIKTINQIKKNVTLKKDVSENEKILKFMFHQYDQAFSELYGLPSAFINRVKGVRGAKKKYAKFLDQKYVIFRDTLIKKVEKEGKFKNVNQAVEGVIEDVEKAFAVFDCDYAIKEINKIKNKIKEEQNELKKFKNTKSPVFAIKPVSTEKRIKKLKNSLKKWTIALSKNELYETFPTIFLLKPEEFFDDILERHLRKDKTFYNLVIEAPIPT